MKNTPEQLALQHSLALCQGHADALQDALQDIKVRGMGVDDYAHLGKEALSCHPLLDPDLFRRDQIWFVGKDITFWVYRYCPHKVASGAAQMPSPKGIVSSPSYSRIPILN